MKYDEGGIINVPYRCSCESTEKQNHHILEEEIVHTTTIKKKNTVKTLETRRMNPLLTKELIPVLCSIACD